MPRIDLDAVEDEWEDAPQAPPRQRRAPKVAVAAEGPEARVVGLHKGWLDVTLEGQVLAAVYGGQMRGEQVAVGDRVRVKPGRHESDTARVVERFERQSVLTRTADDTIAEERVIVANADLAIAVIGPQEVEVGARFVDRVLVAAGAGGLAGALCINKMDLGIDTREVAQLYRSLGYPVVLTSAKTGEGIDDLRGLLAGRWTVMTGHSGVGKSSLFNHLVPQANLEVAELGRFGGRHTTVSARAMAVPGLDGAWLVDTPGVRACGLGHVAPDELAEHFPELAGLECEMPGCLHDGEPGCAAPALGGVSLHAARLDSYRRFLAVLRGD